MDINFTPGSLYTNVTQAARPASGTASVNAGQDVPQNQDEATNTSTIEAAVDNIRSTVQAVQRNLDFSIDDSTGQVVVKVIAKDSGEIIRQMPSEEALRLAQNLKDASSLLFKDQA